MIIYKFIYRFIAVILIVSQALPAQTRNPSLKETALGTPIDSMTEIRLAGKQKPNKVRGQMGMVDNQGIEIRVSGDGGTETRHFTFEEIKTIKLIAITRAAQVAGDAPARAQAAGIPRGTLVELRLLGDQRPNRIRGRIGGATDKDVILQVIQYGNIEDRTFRLDDLQSISTVDSLEIVSKPEKVHRAIGYGLALTLATLGVLALVGGILVATRSGG